MGAAGRRSASGASTCRSRCRPGRRPHGRAECPATGRAGSADPRRRNAVPGFRPCFPPRACYAAVSHSHAAAPHPYSALTPDVVLDACDAAGLRADGRLLTLNSYENRVYQVGLDDGSARVLKFYRPGRWSSAQIEEEHAFVRELAEREIPVGAPEFTRTHAGFLFAVYPRRGGRTPELDNPKTLEWIGRFIGRIHAVGAARRFEFR